MDADADRVLSLTAVADMRAQAHRARRGRGATVWLVVCLLLIGACSEGDHEGSPGATSGRDGDDAGSATTLDVGTVEGPALRLAGSQLLSPAGTLAALPTLPVATPTVEWSATLSGTPSALRADGDLVVVVDGGADTTEVVGLDLDDGTERWRAPLPDAGFYAGVQVVGDLVVVTGSARADGADAASGVAVGVDRDDGTLRWERGLVGFDAQAAPTPAGLVLLGLAESGAVVAASEVAVVDPATGEDRWALELPDSPLGDGSGVAVGDEHVYMSDGEVLRALATADGSERWRVDSPLVGAMTEVGDVVVVGAFADVPDLRAVAVADGTERWRSSVLDGDVLAYSLAALDDGLVVVTYDAGASGSLVVGIDDGELAWDGEGAGIAAGIVGDGPTRLVTTRFDAAAVDVAELLVPEGTSEATTAATADGSLLVADGAVASVSNEAVAAWSLLPEGGAPMWEVPLAEPDAEPVFGPTPAEIVDGTVVVGRGTSVRRLG